MWFIGLAEDSDEILWKKKLNFCLLQSGALWCSGKASDSWSCVNQLVGSIPATGKKTNRGPVAHGS